MVSGFAIVGSLQLTQLLEPLAAFVVFSFRTEVASFLSVAFQYLAAGIHILPLLFALHFAIRAFWVGLVGFASIYPNGIGPHRSSAVPEIYVQDVERRYPSLSTMIDRVERMASGMFANTALLTMLFLGLAATFVVVAGVAYLINFASRGAVAYWTVIKVIGGIGLVIYLAQLLLLYFVDKGKAFAKTPYLEISQVMRVVMFHVFTYPITYLTTVSATNSTAKGSKTFLIAMGIGAAGGLVGLAGVGPLGMALMHIERLPRDHARADRYFEARYQDRWSDDQVALMPYVLHEEVAAGSTLEVFVPMLGEDEYRVGKRKPEIERPDDLSDAEWTKRKSRAWVDAYGEYLQIRMDSTVLLVQELMMHRPPRGYEGVRVLVRVPPGLSGRHELWIRVRESADAGALGFADKAVVPLLVYGGEPQEPR